MINDGKVSGAFSNRCYLHEKIDSIYSLFGGFLIDLPIRRLSVRYMNMYVTASARRRTDVTSRDSPGRAAARRVAVAPESAACTFVSGVGDRWIRTSDPASLCTRQPGIDFASPGWEFWVWAFRSA